MNRGAPRGHRMPAGVADGGTLVTFSLVSIARNSGGALVLLHSSMRSRLAMVKW